jgi:sialic acid synthase SpsE
MRTPFHGISQYPTPYLRGLAALYRVGATFGAWGWSDHGDTLEVAKEAILHGATYLERHYTLGVGRGCRHDAWDTSYDQLKELRTFAEACAWKGTAEHTAACKTYLGRWGA